MYLRTTLQWLASYDLALTGLANRINLRPAFSLVFGGISRLGDGVFWYTLMGALLMVQGHSAMRPVAHMIGTGLVAALLYKAIKTLSGRPRPYTRQPRLRLSHPPLDPFSFPSGHTLHAVCFTCIASYHYPGLLAGLALFSLMIALSRLVLGLHYLSDVAAGAVLGLLLAWASIILLQDPALATQSPASSRTTPEAAGVTLTRAFSTR